MRQRLLALERSGSLQQTNALPEQSGARRPRAPKAAGDKVLILTPVKNAERYLPRYFDLLDRLDYDSAKTSVGLLESDSRDRTFEMMVSTSKDRAGRRRSSARAGRSLRARAIGFWQRRSATRTGCCGSMST
jgi:hypothetical protein